MAIKENTSMLTTKQIADAQKFLQRLKSTPVKVINDHGDVFWEVTYNNRDYIDLLNILTGIARNPIEE